MHATVKVWPLAVRVFHWGLATSFAVAWLAADDLRTLHEWAGYAATALVSLRILMGFTGGGYVRFAQFVRGPRASLRYARDIAAGREVRYLGHNPLGAMMVVTLIAGILTLGLTGWMQTTDKFWGVKWVEEMHEVVADGMLVLVCLHVAGVLLASYRHRENLVLAMVNGRKRLSEPGDVA